MLGKLLKYELQRSAKKFLPLVLGYFGVSVIISILTQDFVGNFFDDSPLAAIPVLLLLLYFGMTIALFVMGFFMSVSNFQKTLFTNEGYLMLTIPVKERNHIFAKLISSMVWATASIIVFFISLVFLNFETLESYAETFKVMIQAFEEEPLTCVLLFVLSLISFAGGQLFFYFLVSASNLFRKKILSGFIIVVISYIINSFTFTLFREIMDNMLETPFTEYYRSYSKSDLMSYVNSMMIGCIIYQLIYCVIFYFLTNYVVTKKFNLQ